MIIINKIDVIQTILAAYPEFPITQVELFSEGQNLEIFRINEEWIFRFPKYERGIDELKREVEFLKDVRNKLSVSVPDPIYTSLKTNAFVGYRMLKGKPLKKEVFDSIENKNDLVKELAIFMRSLHGVDKLDSMLGSAENEYEIWHNLFLRMKEKVFVHMSEKARQSVSANFASFLHEIRNSEFKRTVIHGDFGPTNLLYDAINQSLSGVIDFGSVTIGDPALDLAAAFCGPFGLGTEWLAKVTYEYPEAAAFVERASFYASTFALQEALFGIENDDAQAFERGISSYQ